MEFYPLVPSDPLWESVYPICQSLLLESWISALSPDKRKLPTRK